MQHEARAVEGVVAFYDFARMIGEDQVGNLDLREMHRHRVRPVKLGKFRIADGEMARKSVIEAMNGESATSAHEVFLAIFSLLGICRKFRTARELEARLLGLIDGDTLVGLQHKLLLTVCSD
ncbi:MAG: hypothetical protein NVSMB5_00510 [Candidatus Velthaea sp.]